MSRKQNGQWEGWPEENVKLGTVRSAGSACDGNPVREPAAPAWNESLDALLKGTSRSFYLSLRILPNPLREPLGIAYLLARASDTCADSTRADLQSRLRALDALGKALESLNSASEPDAANQPDTAAEEAIRLAGALPGDTPAEGALLARIGTVLAAFREQSAPVRAEIRAVLTHILGGQRGDLLRFGYASKEAPVALFSAAECEAYTYAVAGCVGEFWTRICAVQMPGSLAISENTLMAHGRLLGQGLQLVNILRDLPADLARGCCYLPLEEIAAHGLQPRDLLKEPAQARALIAPWIQKAHAWLDHGEAYVRGIRGARLRLSVSLPRRLGKATLALLEKHPPLETPFRVRANRSAVYRCAASALWEACWGASLAWGSDPER